MESSGKNESKNQETNTDILMQFGTQLNVGGKNLLFGSSI